MRLHFRDLGLDNRPSARDLPAQDHRMGRALFGEECCHPLAVRAPLMLPCTVTRSSNAWTFLGMGSANEILAVTKENVPE